MRRHKMNILHLAYDDVDNPWGGGGGPYRTHEIGRRLADRGHRYTILSGWYPGAKDKTRDKVLYRYLGRGRSFVSTAISYMALTQWYLMRSGRQYDIVVEDFSAFTPLFAHWLAGTASMVQLQLYTPDRCWERFGIWGRLLRQIQRYYPRTFRHAVFLTRDLGSHWPCGGQRRYWIGNGIPASYLTTPARTGDYLLFLGRLVWKDKGLDVLSQAMPLVWRRHPETKLVLAGRGPDESPIKKAFVELSTQHPGTVVFPGFVVGKAKQELLAGCRALVLPSRTEGEPLCVLEAAACGKPVIGSSITELKFLGHEGIGLNTITGDPRSLANGVLQLLDDGDLSDRLARRGRQWAAEHTWDRAAEEFESAMRTVLRTRKAVIAPRRRPAVGDVESQEVWPGTCPTRSPSTEFRT